MADEKQTGMASKIQKVLDELRGTEEWEKSRQAFRTIIGNLVHGEKSKITDEELDRHLLQTLTITQDDINRHLDSTRSSVPEGEKAESRYYVVTAQHNRNDRFFATLARDDDRPTGSGNGKQTLKARFQAKNLYERFRINKTITMPDKTQNLRNLRTGDFSTWKSIREAMANKNKIKQTFDLTKPDQVESVWEVVSKWGDWNSVEGDLFITPNLKGWLGISANFSPALFAIYFFWRGESAAKGIFVVITADGGGTPKSPFIGLVNGPADPRKNVFDSKNRFAFSYLSNEKNPVKYWMDVPVDHIQGFTLGIQTFFPSRPTPYIEVISNFTPAKEDDKDYFLNTWDLPNKFIIMKAFLMRDLIKPYYPNSGYSRLWDDVLIGTEGLLALLSKALLISDDKLNTPEAHPPWDQKPIVVDVTPATIPGALMQTSYTSASGWGTSNLTVETSGEKLDRAPAPLVKFREERFDVFWKAADGSLMDTWLNGKTWVTTDLSANGGKNLLSAPAPVVGFKSGRIDVFWAASDSSLMQICSTDGSNWTTANLSEHGALLASEPAPVVREKGEVHVFWKHGDGSLMDTAWTGSWRTTNLSSFGGKNLASAPAPVVGFKSGRIDVFWTAAD